MWLLERTDRLAPAATARVTHLATRAIYGLLNRKLRHTPWTCLNYGWATLDGVGVAKETHLPPEDGRGADRLCLQLYERVARERVAGKRVLVIGGGHSAINVALALMELRAAIPGTEIFWALRHGSVERLLGGGLNDQLPERGALGLAAKQAMADGRLNILAPFAVNGIAMQGEGLAVDASLAGKPFSLFVDRIVVTTGFRPDLSFLGEIRIALDPVVEAPPALAPLIDPNFHSCGTVPAHGIRELAHPEPGFTIVGSKSYGRAPTFLMATGYEQVRSVVADIAGDHVAAREVHLVLPETGVCSADVVAGPEDSAGCCGGPAPADVDACCVRDADAKARGASGCGCGTASAGTEAKKAVAAGVDA